MIRLCLLLDYPEGEIVSAITDEYALSDEETLRLVREVREAQQT